MSPKNRPKNVAENARVSCACLVQSVLLVFSVCPCCLCLYVCVCVCVCGLRVGISQCRRGLSSCMQSVLPTPKPVQLLKCQAVDCCKIVKSAVKAKAQNNQLKRVDVPCEPGFVHGRRSVKSSCSLTFLQSFFVWDSDCSEVLSEFVMEVLNELVYTSVPFASATKRFDRLHHSR